MKKTLKLVEKEIDLLEATVDKYHRAVRANVQAPCSYSKLQEKLLAVTCDLNDVDGSSRLAMRSAAFRRLMVIAVHIDDLRQK